MSSVVIGQFQIETEGEAPKQTAAPAARAPSAPSAAATPPHPVRIQTQVVIRQYRERLARVRT